MVVFLVGVAGSLSPLDFAVTWQNVQLFFSFFVYSGLAYERVEETTTPASKTSPGNAYFIRPSLLFLPR